MFRIDSPPSQTYLLGHKNSSNRNIELKQELRKHRRGGEGSLKLSEKVILNCLSLSQFGLVARLVEVSSSFPAKHNLNIHVSQLEVSRLTWGAVYYKQTKGKDGARGDGGGGEEIGKG